MDQKKTPAIVVVTYNRPKSLLRLLNSINSAYYDHDVNLIISIDKAENYNDVLSVAEGFIWSHGRKTIRSFPERQGLRRHVIQCGDLSEQYGSVIILEDDLIVSPGYYSYVKEALNYYENSDEITGIALYSHEWNGYGNRFFSPVVDEYDSYLGQFSITWGQCWTKKWWQSFKQWYITQPEELKENPALPMHINRWSKQSWGRYFANYITQTGKYYVIPRFSFSTNCSEVGQHVSFSDSDHQVRLVEGVRKHFSFAPCCLAVKYDIFFENMELNKYLDKEIVEQGVDIDLSGYGRNNPQNRYILSSVSLPFRKIQSFGLMLRPIEMNVRYNIPGNDIRLYDKTVPSKKEKYNMNRIRYEIRGMATKDILVYVIHLIWKKIRTKLSR